MDKRQKMIQVIAMQIGDKIGSWEEELLGQGIIEAQLADLEALGVEDYSELVREAVVFVIVVDGLGWD